MKNSKMVITDFDGTLADSNRKITRKNLETLHNLGQAGIPRVVATGRNLHSFTTAAPPDLPIDYLVFSTGAGVLDWKNKKLLAKSQLEKDVVRHNTEMLIDENKDFMLHFPIPDNHKFLFHRFHSDNHDFETRLNYYGEFAQQLDRVPDINATQLLAVLHWDELSELERLSTLAERVKVIKTTSPITGTAIWMELFPEGISKAFGINWLCEKLGINHNYCVVVGNDYNDLDMLHFTEKSYVVEISPDDLKSEFNTVASVENSGFAEAVNFHIDI